MGQLWHFRYRGKLCAPPPHVIVLRTNRPLTTPKGLSIAQQPRARPFQRDFLYRGARRDLLTGAITIAGAAVVP
jgi:hypothetical protein